MLIMRWLGKLYTYNVSAMAGTFVLPIDSYPMQFVVLYAVSAAVNADVVKLILVM